MLLLAVIAAPPAQAAGTLAGTSISNQAYADYKDANGNAMTRVYSNTVTVTVTQVASVTTTPETAANNAVAGTNIAYAVTITNSGNGTDTITLAVTTTLGTVKLYKDDNGDGIWQPTETTEVSTTGPLAADASFKVFAVIAVPAGAANGTTGTTTVTTTSTHTGTVKDDSTFTTTAQAAVLAASKSSVDPASNSTLVTTAKPGDIITYMVTVTNTGAPGYDLVYSDVIPANTTYVAGSMKAGASTSYNSAPNTLTDANDGYEFTAGTAPTTAQVGAYFDSANNRIVLTKTNHPPQGNFYFKVRVNDNVPAGTVISNTISIDYALVSGSAIRYTATSNASTVSVAQKPGVLLSSNRTGSQDTGGQIVYAFTAQNTGNAPDTINLTYPSTSGWSWALWKDTDNNGIPGTNGDTLLTDTNGDGKIDTGILAQGDTIAILAVATVPSGTISGTVDNTVVTGASSITPTTTSSVTLTTTVKAPVLTVNKGITAVQAPNNGAVCTPTNQSNGLPCTVVPGSVLTYTVTVTNAGNGNATNVVITDLIPQYTTYKPGSIKTGSSVGSLVARTDASDGDGGRYENGAVIAGAAGNLSPLGPGGTWVLEFQVTVN